VSGHPNAERLLRGFGAFVQRDLDALHELFADGVRWTIPGGSALGGTYVGVPQVLEMLGRAVALTGGTYTTTLSFVLADDEHAVAAYRATGSRDGHELDVEQLLVCRFQGERIAEVQALPFDQAVFDAFWA
jgi:ketosteroid isomerase-like protein